MKAEHGLGFVMLAVFWAFVSRSDNTWYEWAWAVVGTVVVLVGLLGAIYEYRKQRGRKPLESSLLDWSDDA